MRKVAEPLDLPPKRSAAGLIAVGLLMVLVYLPTTRWLVERWSLGVWFQLHGFAVFPIAIWLAWGPLRDLKDRGPEASAWGFAFLVPAILLHVLDAALQFQVLSAVSFLLAIPGLCLLFLGRQRTRAIWFPLLFLAFAVPIPLMVVRKIHFALRQIAAVGSGHVLDLMGYEVSRQATTLQVGPAVVEIADACSGFSTLTALLMVTLLLTYLARAKWWQAGLMLALVFPIAAFANLLRCVFLIMLVAAFDTDVLSTLAHPASGVATFLLALVIMMGAERFILPSPAKEAAS